MDSSRQYDKKQQNNWTTLLFPKEMKISRNGKMK
jgi:hypothetical protein